MLPNPWLALSSLSFLTSATTCYKTSNYFLTALYIAVSLVSSIYHITKNPYLVYIDYSLSQFAHVSTVYYIVNGKWSSMPAYAAWLSYVVFIYYYGYKNKILIWDPDLQAATPWHMSLHISTAATTSYTVYATNRFLALQSKELMNSV